MLVEVLQSDNQAAAAQAAGALWSLCVDNDANKQARTPPPTPPPTRERERQTDRQTGKQAGRQTARVSARACVCVSE